MSMNDPIADMLTTIRNGQSAKLATVTTPASKKKEAVLAVLLSEGYIRGYKRADVRKGLVNLEVELKYHEGNAAIQEIVRASKPGRREYSPVEKLGKVRGGLGIFIVSTSKGVMADHEARRQNVGGEVICGVF